MIKAHAAAALTGLLGLLAAACAAASPPAGASPTGAPPIGGPPASAVASPSAVTPSQAAPSPGGASPAPGQAGSPEAEVVAVTLTDALRIEPARMTVSAGQPVTFVVTNDGELGHEFYLGDEAAQAAHEAEMEALGGETLHDTDSGIGVPPGETKELTLDFPAPGVWLAGCHVTNHYSGGMRATITVTD